jgi:hypothetical protein
VEGEKKGRREGKKDDEGVEMAVWVTVTCKQVMVMTSNDSEEVQ